MSPILSVVIIGAFQYKSNSNYACTRMISQLCYLVGKEISVSPVTDYCQTQLFSTRLYPTFSTRQLPHYFPLGES